MPFGSIRRYRLVLWAALAAATVLPLSGCATPGATAGSAAVRAELAPSGTLPTAINFGNPILAGKNGATGQAQGASVDIARTLGSRLGVPVELLTCTSASQVVEAVKGGKVDIALVAIDPVRGADMGFTAPYVIIEGAYMFRQGSPVRLNSELDQTGRRVVVGRFMVIEQAMATPKGRDAGVRYLREFVEDLKRSGFVAEALGRHGIEGAAVAPPARP